MVIKSNVATPQRPKGNRMINAPLININLEALINQIKEESPWKESDRNSVTVLKSDTLRIVLMGLHETAELKTHKANAVISVQVLEGRLTFITPEQTQVIEKGQMIALQNNIPHSALALTETFFLLTLAMNKE